MGDAAPRLFVSYSWSSPDHEAWVLELATELRENGIDVVLDKWDLREGHDAFAFMEQMVSDDTITKVIMICDRTYAEKANDRSGGVGAEAQIISPEIYAKQDQGKFVAVIAERDEQGNPYLPTYYKSRIYVDFSDASRHAENYEQLLRWAFDRPLHVKPEIGSTPAFLSADNRTITLGTAATFRRAVEAIRNGRAYWRGAATEYFTTFSEQLERFRLPSEEGERDDQLIDSIEAFLPYRDQAVELFFALAQYQPGEESAQALHRFFEQLIPYMDRPEEVTSWNECDFDNFRFIVHELFLYAVAVQLRHECFGMLGSLLTLGFYCPDTRSGESGMVSFSTISRHIRLLDYRNQRLEKNRMSLQADILKDRTASSGVDFKQLMQADFFLHLRDTLDCLSGNSSWVGWDPITLVYAARQYSSLEVFGRSQSKAYFEKVCSALGINGKADIDALVDAYNTGKLRRPAWDHFHSVNHELLMAHESLATKP